MQHKPLQTMSYDERVGQQQTDARRHLKALVEQIEDCGGKWILSDDAKFIEGVEEQFKTEQGFSFSERQRETLASIYDKLMERGPA